jgi:hypothetical protein
MGKLTSLFKAYKTAAETGSRYRDSLQDIMNIGYDKEHSRQMFEIDKEESSRKFAAGHQLLSLISTVAGGAQTQKEAAADITKAFPGAEQTYGESKFGDFFRSAKGTEGRRGEGETRLGELGEKIGVLLGGKERKWTLSEEVGGVEAGEYKQSNILASAKQTAFDKLGMGDSGGCPAGQMRDENGDCVPGYSE